jgi:Putative peptidoglycan-binding domain-containing protein
MNDKDKQNNQETTAINMPTLKLGDFGNPVIILEGKLQDLNYLEAPIREGFDLVVEGAVKRFQKHNDLEVTGIIDQNNWDLIFELTKSQFPTPKNITTKPTLRLGSTGPYVIELQTILTQMLYYTSPIDGVFGTTTDNAVRQFQKVNHLTADGIVGRATWAALDYLFSPLAICNEVEPPSPPLIPEPENPAVIRYVVRAGDTLFSIARAHNTTIEAIMQLNNLTTTTLTIGQILMIPTSSNNTQIHVVRAGDTLFSIARQFNITVDEIRRLNNLTTDMLTIGQHLLIPLTNQQHFEYTVVAGDSLFALATRFNTTIEAIIQLNNLTDTRLSIGQVLMIPGSMPNRITHVVRAGDTLFSIALMYNTTVNEIRSLNNLTSNTLTIGQHLLIPTR